MIYLGVAYLICILLTYSALTKYLVIEDRKRKRGKKKNKSKNTCNI